MSSTHGRLGLLQIGIAGVLWGTGGLGVQLVREQVSMSVLTISAWRIVLAAVPILGLLLLRRGLPRLVAMVRHRPRRVLAVGLSTAGFQVLFFLAVTWVGVTVATVVSLGLAPVLLTIAEALAVRRVPPPSRLLVVAAALVGLVLVSLASSPDGAVSGPRPVAGLVAAAASGALYALATAWGGTLARESPPLVLTAATTSVAVLALVPLALLSGGPRLTADPQALGVLVYLGLFTMGLAYACFYAGLRTTSGAAAALVTLVEPLSAAVLAALVLDERLAPAGIAGALLILAAVAGLSRDDPAAVAVVAGPSAGLPAVPEVLDPQESWDQHPDPESDPGDLAKQARPDQRPPTL